jgi:hypothetical protein
MRIAMIGIGSSDSFLEWFADLGHHVSCVDSPRSRRFDAKKFPYSSQDSKSW